MTRLKSIDILRGLSMCWMFLGHLEDWWLIGRDNWFNTYTHAIFDVVGSSAFLFVSGLSTAISYRNRVKKAESTEGYDMKSVKYEYFFRNLIIFIIALFYNLSVAITINKLEWIWSWFILLTIGVCLAIAWPLLNTPKWFRIFVGGVLWVLDIFILEYLAPSQGIPNFNGFLYHILYNPIGLDPILIFFSFFLIGTVVGDVISESFQIKNESERNEFIKNKIIYPSLVIGIILIIIGIILPFPDQKHHYVEGFLLEFPLIFIRGSFIWRIFTLGFLLVLFSLLSCLDLFPFFKTEKSYKFLFYFSYYSLTVYLAHNIMYFLFLNQLTIPMMLICVGGAVIFWGLMLRAIYNSKWRDTFSVKVNISKLSTYLTKRFVNVET